MRRARGLLAHLHKKWRLWGKKPRLCVIYVGPGSIPRSSDPLMRVRHGAVTCPGAQRGSRPWAAVKGKWRHRTWGGATRLFDNFVNFSPPFNILSGRLKAARRSCHYLQQPVAYCNSSLQSRQDVFEFVIAAESASNLPLGRRSVRACVRACGRAASVCAHPQ